MKKLLVGGLLLLLFGASCKKENNSPVPVNPTLPSTPAKDLRVRRYAYDYNGKTNYYTYTYDAQKRIDSVYYAFPNGNGGTFGYTYTPTGFEREGISYLTENNGRITLQSVPSNHQQFKGFYDAAGRLSYVVYLSTYNGQEEARRWYTWDGDGNLLQQNWVSIRFDTAGRWLVNDSTTTIYSDFTVVNTTDQKAFGFDHFGMASVNAFWASPDGIQSSRMLPATERTTHYIFATPRASHTSYSQLEDLPAVTYTFTKDEKGRIRTIVNEYSGKPVTQTYEYYD